MQLVDSTLEADYPWYVRLIFWAQRRKYGRELEPARLWGRTPRAFAGLTLLYRALDRAASPITPGLRSLITVRISQINWCAFCVDLNSATALARSVSPEKLADLANFAVSPHYAPRERAALRLAEAMTITGRAVDAPLAEELRRHFDDDAIIELAALVAFQNMSSKFNSGLGVPPQGFCKVPQSGGEDCGCPPDERECQ